MLRVDEEDGVSVLGGSRVYCHWASMQCGISRSQHLVLGSGHGWHGVESLVDRVGVYDGVVADCLVQSVNDVPDRRYR